MTALLRGSAKRGYRTSAPLTCPHCAHAIHLSGHVLMDKTGPHMALWAVAERAGGYTEAELRHVYAGPPVATGVALPQPVGACKLVDDPLPDFGEPQ